MAAHSYPKASEWSIRLGHRSVIKSGDQVPTTPLTSILSPKGRGNDRNARLAPPGERPAPLSFAGTGEGELDRVATL
jgi:hypothetical protein